MKEFCSAPRVHAALEQSPEAPGERLYRPSRWLEGVSAALAAQVRAGEAAKVLIDVLDRLAFGIRVTGRYHAKQPGSVARR